MSKTSTSSSSRAPLVLLDANMLMLAANGIRVFEHIEEQLASKPRYLILRPVYNELVKIATTGPPQVRRKALFALKLVEVFCEVVDYGDESSTSVDDLIIKYALENRAIVATNDRELRSKLRKLGIPEAYFREESRRVVVEGYFK
ncbi:MAG: PIN domain-containing protein [Desulfurococcaceae archaeon]